MRDERFRSTGSPTKATAVSVHRSPNVGQSCSSRDSYAAKQAVVTARRVRGSSHFRPDAGTKIARYRLGSVVNVDFGAGKCAVIPKRSLPAYTSAVVAHAMRRMHMPHGKRTQQRVSDPFPSLFFSLQALRIRFEGKWQEDCPAIASTIFITKTICSEWIAVDLGTHTKET
ncbi:hypothetical protein MRX96_054354 [Rhipicephalus microplus]